MEEILELMNKHYVGKTFIYKSKYGGVTEGICSKVVATNTFTTNETVIDVLKGFEKGVDTFKTIKNKVTKELVDKKEDLFFASRVEYSILSTKGITYDMTEIYFKN